MADLFEMVGGFLPNPQQITQIGTPLLAIVGLTIGAVIAYLSRDKIWNSDIVRGFRFGGGIPLIVKGKEWPNEVRIYEDRHGGSYSEIDYGKYVCDVDMPLKKQEGYEYWELYHARVIVPAPELGDLITGPKGEAIAHFYCPSRGTFYPMRLIMKLNLIKEADVTNKNNKLYATIEGKEIEVVKTKTGYLPVNRSLIPIKTVSGKALDKDDKAIDIKLHPVLSESMKIAYRLQITKNMKTFANDLKVDTWLMYGGFMLLVIGTLLWMTVNNSNLTLIAESYKEMVPPLREIGKHMPDFVRIMNNTINKPMV